MEPKTALIRAKGRVELDSKASVDAKLAFVVLPDNSELDDTFRNGAYFQCCAVFGMLLEKCAILEGACKLCNRRFLSVLMCHLKQFRKPQFVELVKRTLVGLLEFGLNWKVRHGDVGVVCVCVVEV